MATSDSKRDLIGELLRIPPLTATFYTVPVGNILNDIHTTRPELLAVVGSEAKPLIIAGWNITYDEARDRVRFMRAKAIASPTTYRPPVTRPTSAPAPMNPVTVGSQAQAYQREQRAKGREISATEAVAHIMAQNKR